jgi:hypothetical protein
MDLQIKLIIAVGLIILGGLAAWYVQGLRADNARLQTELASVQALARARALQLEQMQASLQILEAARQAGQSQADALQRQLASARAAGAQKGESCDVIESSVAIIIADNLNAFSERLRGAAVSNR